MSARSVVVVGAGAGGLSAALMLARRGCHVTVLERHREVGGKASRRTEAGFTWDEGPSIVVMPWVYRQLFAQCDLDPDAYLPLDRLDPAFRVIFPDGLRLEIPAEESGVADSFASVDPADGKALGPFLRKLDRFAAVIGHSYCDRIVESWPQIATSPLMTSALVISPFQKYATEVDRTFRSQRIRELLYGFPTYSGFNPQSAPASLLIIAWTIIREGVWYPRKGGIAAIPRSIADACQHLGVEFRMSTEVETIEREASGAVIGVQTSSGYLRADAVVSNSDYVHTHRLLTGGPPLTEEVEKIRRGEVEPSASFFTIQLGCKRQWELNAHHLLVLTSGSSQVYDEVYRRGEYPADPPLYVNITSVTDPQDAPLGGCNPFVVIGAPPLPSQRHNNPDADEAYADRLLHRLESAGFEGLHQSTVCRRVVGPSLFRDRFHAFRGAIYGLSDRYNILGGGFRPLNFRREVPGLYFVGGGVQPGAGLPMAVQSGKIVAARLCSEIRARRTVLAPNASPTSL